MSTGIVPLTSAISRKRPLHLTIHSASQPHHHRWIRPPPRSPYPWIWSCHKCLTIYRFSAALNRCLSCSHHFCRKCISEYDYSGWDEWKAYWTPPSPLLANDEALHTSKEHWGKNNDNENEEDEDWDAEWLAWSPSSASSDSGDCSNKEYYTRTAFCSEKNECYHHKDALGECNAEAKILREAEKKKYSHTWDADFLTHEVYDDEKDNDETNDNPVLSPDLNTQNRQIFAPIQQHKRSVCPPPLHLDMPPVTTPGKETDPSSQQIIHVDCLSNLEESVLSPLGYQHLVPLISEGAVEGYEPDEEMMRLVTPATTYSGAPIMVREWQQSQAESDDWRMAVDEVIGGLDTDEEGMPKEKALT